MYLFSGLQFQHSSSEGVDGYNFGTQSAIRIVNGDDIIISDCEFSHIGMTAVFVKTSNRSPFLIMYFLTLVTMES